MFIVAKKIQYVPLLGFVRVVQPGDTKHAIIYPGDRISKRKESKQYFNRLKISSRDQPLEAGSHVSENRPTRIEHMV